jgi:acyl dehydratase
LIVVGETCSRSVRHSREDIAEFARLTGDDNPLHFDQQRAQRARHGEVIASAQQTSGQMIGLAASHFSHGDDGSEHELLCLNFNFAFKAPVFAEQEVRLQWTVSQVDWNSRLHGWVGQIDGTARVAGRPCVIGRGTLLLKLSDHTASKHVPPGSPDVAE